jgi:hypothetical protein
MRVHPIFNGRLLHFSPHFPNTKMTTKESNRNNQTVEGNRILLLGQANPTTLMMCCARVTCLVFLSYFEAIRDVAFRIVVPHALATMKER